MSHRDMLLEWTSAANGAWFGHAKCSRKRTLAWRIQEKALVVTKAILKLLNGRFDS
jgi:hypothetical protein